MIKRPKNLFFCSLCIWEYKCDLFYLFLERSLYVYLFCQKWQKIHFVHVNKSEFLVKEFNRSGYESKSNLSFSIGGIHPSPYGWIMFSKHAAFPSNKWQLQKSQRLIIWSSIGQSFGMRFRSLCTILVVFLMVFHPVDSCARTFWTFGASVVSSLTTTNNNNNNNNGGDGGGGESGGEGGGNNNNNNNNNN